MRHIGLHELHTGISEAIDSQASTANFGIHKKVVLKDSKNKLRACTHFY